METFQVSGNFPGNFRKLPRIFQPCDVSLALVLGPCLLKSLALTQGLESSPWPWPWPWISSPWPWPWPWSSSPWPWSWPWNPSSLALGLGPGLNPKSLLTSLQLHHFQAHLMPVYLTLSLVFCITPTAISPHIRSVHSFIHIHSFASPSPSPIPLPKVLLSFLLSRADQRQN